MGKQTARFILFFVILSTFNLNTAVMAKEKMVVMDLKAAYGVDASLAEALSVVVRNTIHGLGHYEVIGKADIDAIADAAAKRQYSGCTQERCLIDFGQLLGAEYMVAGSLSKIGSAYSLGLRLLSTMGTDAGVKKRIGKECECDETELVDIAKAAARQLMGKKVVDEAPSEAEVSQMSRVKAAGLEKETSATLAVTSSPGSAVVMLDERYIGKTPVKRTLPPGTYRVAVRKSGYRLWGQTVTLKAGETGRFDAALTPFEIQGAGGKRKPALPGLAEDEIWDLPDVPIPVSAPEGKTQVLIVKAVGDTPKEACAVATTRATAAFFEGARPTDDVFKETVYRKYCNVLQRLPNGRVRVEVSMEFYEGRSE